MNIANWQFSSLAAIALSAVPACHASNSVWDGGAADLPFAEASADRTATPDSREDDADANGPNPLHDCFPDCVKALRAECERPPVNAGYCELANTPDGVTFCYSNGVREIPQDVDGGELVVITQPDGKTACYQISIDYSTGVQHFQTGSGQEVAQVASLGGGLFSVTCNGTTQTIDNNDPTCATLTSADCNVVVTACP